MNMDYDYNYGAKERETVKEGIESIRAVLCGEDGNAKRRLLFYLDWYIDPYYKNDLSVLYELLKELLQEVVISENEEDVIEEAIHLLEAYTDPPFEILEENTGKWPGKFTPDIRYLVNTKD